MNCYSVFFMWIIRYVMMPYCHGRHTPLGLYYARESWECDTEAKGRNAKKKKKNSALPPRGNTIQNRQFRLRECYQNFTSPQSEILYLFRFTVPFAEMRIQIFIPPSLEYDLELTIPLTGIQSKYCIPASGDNFVEMHIKIYIPPLREYDPESTVPLTGMQSKYCIPASGAYVTISRRCT